METTEIIVTVTIHRSERAKGGQAVQREGFRWWIARLNVWTVAWYALLTVAGILLYNAVLPVRKDHPGLCAGMEDRR